MVGGLITSAALTLIVLPAIYSLWREYQLNVGAFPASSPRAAAVPA
jgi:hypothetical protein